MATRFRIRNFGGALSFNGSTSAITTGYNPFTSQMAFSGWAKRANMGANHALMGGDTSGSVPIIRFDSGSMLFKFFAGAASSNFTAAQIQAAGWAPGQWAHWVINTDQVALTCSLYVNGVLVATNSYSTTFGTTGNFIVGRRGINNDTFQGLQDEVRVWNRTLTATEIAALYFQGIVPQNGLLLEYLFNEGSGTTATDTSGNGKTGTITNCTYVTDVRTKLRTLIS